MWNKPGITLFPAVNAAVRKEGRLLLTRRSQKIREPGLWCLPGGHLDGGESWMEGTLRELKEETGLRARDGQLLGIYSDPSTNTTTDHPGAPTGVGQFVTAVILFDAFVGNVTPNEEVDEWGWFAPGEIPGPMIASHLVRIDDVWRFSGQAFIR